MKLLLTAFEPFAGEALNPTMMMLENLDTSEFNGEIIKVLLPTSFKEAKVKLIEAMEEYKPDVVLSLGQAMNRTGISLERVAINVMDARIEDNSGYKPVDEPISSEAAYFSSLPLRKLESALRQKNIPASISNTAGTFVCNMVMYLALEKLKGTDAKAGFIHVPMVHEQVLDRNIASLSMETLMEALKKILEVLLEEHKH